MTKSARWGWVVAAVAATGVVLVLVFVLALTGEAPAFYEQQFVWLSNSDLYKPATGLEWSDPSFRQAGALIV